MSDHEPLAEHWGEEFHHKTKFHPHTDRNTGLLADKLDDQLHPAIKTISSNIKHLLAQISRHRHLTVEMIYESQILDVLRILKSRQTENNCSEDGPIVCNPMPKKH
jgi:hypothetical protein